MTDRKSSTDLDFKAVSEGLGFHPFSDGLPYAPVTKKSAARPYPGNDSSERASHAKGAGATLAGPLSVSPTITRPIARINVPVAAPYQPAPIHAATPSTLGVPTGYYRSGKSTTASPVEMLPSAHFAVPTFGFVYLFKRISAYALDSALNLAAVVAALSFVLVRNDVNPDALLSSGVVLLTVVFLAFFNWAVITAQEIAFGTSIGKRVFGLGLNGSASAVFLRAFFFLPSVGFAGLGLIWALFNRERRCWHDVAVDLQPQEIAQL